LLILKNIKFDNIANNWFVYVSPKNMAVKFAKVRHAYFMSWSDDIRDNVLRWVKKLRELGWTDDAPVFPALYDDFGQSDLLQTVHTPTEIKSGTTIIKVFKDAFTGAGLPYYRPHSFRDTIAIWSELNGTPAFFNAVSQSLGHSSPKTTFSIYGKFPPARIGEIMKNNHCLI
jgi:integrase/recombinase XerD